MSLNFLLFSREREIFCSLLRRRQQVDVKSHSCLMSFSWFLHPSLAWPRQQRANTRIYVDDFIQLKLPRQFAFQLTRYFWNHGKNHQFHKIMNRSSLIHKFQRPQNTKAISHFSSWAWNSSGALSRLLTNCTGDKELYH